MRTGGPPNQPYHETIAGPVPVELTADDGTSFPAKTLPALNGTFLEVVFDLPAGVTPTVHTRAASPYRVFHWFVLQPE
jgi:hypothetical protein